MDYVDLLGRIAVNDARVVDTAVGAATLDGDAPLRGTVLDAKTLALTRLAALVAMGGAVPSYGAHVDAAVGAGATDAEIVEVLVGLTPVVGLARVVSAAPKLALVLGFDVEGLEPWPAEGR